MLFGLFDLFYMSDSYNVDLPSKCLLKCKQCNLQAHSFLNVLRLNRLLRGLFGTKSHDGKPFFFSCSLKFIMMNFHSLKMVLCYFVMNTFLPQQELFCLYKSRKEQAL